METRYSPATNWFLKYPEGIARVVGSRQPRRFSACRFSVPSATTTRPRNGRRRTSGSSRPSSSRPGPSITTRPGRGHASPGHPGPLVRAAGQRPVRSSTSLVQGLRERHAASCCRDPKCRSCRRPAKAAGRLDDRRTTIPGLPRPWSIACGPAAGRRFCRADRRLPALESGRRCPRRWPRSGRRFQSPRLRRAASAARDLQFDRLRAGLPRVGGKSERARLLGAAIRSSRSTSKRLFDVVLQATGSEALPRPLSKQQCSSWSATRLPGSSSRRWAPTTWPRLLGRRRNDSAGTAVSQRRAGQRHDPVEQPALGLAADSQGSYGRRGVHRGCICGRSRADPSEKELSQWRAFLASRQPVAHTAGPPTDVKTGIRRLSVRFDDRPIAGRHRLQGAGRSGATARPILPPCGHASKNNADGALYVKAFEAWAAEAPFQQLASQAGGNTSANKPSRTSIGPC